MTVVAWEGKPTSGRFVYKTRDRKAWVWQCDLHPCPPDEVECWGHPAEWDEWGEGFATMEAALAEAFRHAMICPYTNKEEQ